MADTAPEQLTKAASTSDQPKKTEKTGPAVVAQAIEKLKKTAEDAEKDEKENTTSTEKPAGVPVSSDKDAVPASSSAAAAAAEEGAKVVDSDSTTHTKAAPAKDQAQDQAKADAPLPTTEKEQDQPPKAPDNQTTDSAMAEAAKEDKAPVSPVADTTKETGDDVKADSKSEETRADDVKEAAAETTEEKKDESSAGAAAEEAKPAKAPTTLARRKSVGQKLNRKGSKARIVHLDAKPGEHYFVKLKGYPAWPAVICDEDMLPQTLIKGRPVTAARPDGTYREDYADGGKRAHDRTFPVMYLYTNEFGWVPNTDMIDLDPEKALASINDKMRKDLQQAHKLAAENHPLDYYKDLLRQFQEELEEAEEAKRQAAEAKRLAASTPKKSKKAAKEDVDMLDVPEDDDEQATASSKKSKKRKADDDTRTPQRSDSVKKPKIKITSSGTPKSNGTPTASKSKQTSKASAVGKTKEAVLPVEPELSPAEKRQRKAKEVLFLRHKIQKGLLTRDQVPKEEEMKAVSDYLTKLEGFPDLEVGVIRETKINKVLKAILKIATIPREGEFEFKKRSQALLEKWNKLLAAEPAPEGAAATNGASATTNGNGEAKSNGVKKDDEKKEEKAGSEPAAESEKKDTAVEAAA